MIIGGGEKRSRVVDANYTGFFFFPLREEQALMV